MVDGLITINGKQYFLKYDMNILCEMKMDGFEAEDLDIINNGNVDYITLNKLAIKYADGIIQASPNVNEELIEFAKSLNKPFMEYPGEENYIDAYAQFYQT